MYENFYISEQNFEDHDFRNGSVIENEFCVQIQHFVFSILNKKYKL